MMNNQSINQESSGNCSHSAYNPGCGCNDVSGIVITISPTTGGQFSLVVRKTDSVDHVKKIISKKLKVLRERICLLHRDRQLMNGSLQENDLNNGSRLTLLPIVETGLTTQRPELSVMNALESLNEAQVNDFLSGKAPLNLTMRLGDHMMLIQLMLSTFSNQNQASSANGPKAEFSSTNLNATSTEGKRKEISGDVAQYVLVDKPSCATYSSPRLERILSSTAAEMSLSNDECSTNYNSDSNNIINSNIVQDKTEGTSAPRRNSSRLPPTRDSSSASKDHPCSSSSCNLDSCLISSTCTTDSAVPLAKATRNLTQTLQKLSSEVLTSKKVATVHQKYKGTNNSIMHFNKKPNAILENMEHHGRGIYSGTFSGTLNPALQDRFGRPKKDVSTIIHILNDLLCAEPRSQCKPSCTCTSPVTEKMETCLSEASSAMSVVSSTDSVDGIIKSSPFDFVSSQSLVVDKCNVNVLSKHNENQTTRSKMEQLKSIMEERKEKRKEKRFSPYEKRFPSLNLLSSSTVSPADAWSSTTSDSAAMHASKSNDSLEKEQSSMHSKPVIA